MPENKARKGGKPQRELGEGPHSRDIDGWQPQQPDEKDDISNKNGKNKMKGALRGRNDQHMHSLRDGVGNGTSPLRNAHGVEMASTIVLADEPHTPCPPGFNPNPWKFDLGIDTEKFRSTGIYVLYRKCMKSIYKEDRKVLLDFWNPHVLKLEITLLMLLLKREVIFGKDYIEFLYGKNSIPYRKGLSNILNSQVIRVKEIEKEITGDTEQGVKMLVRKRSSNTKHWVGYATSFKSHMDDLNVETRKGKSLEDIINLWTHANQLPKFAYILIKMGTSLLYLVSIDIFSWNQIESMYVLFPADDSW